MVRVDAELVRQALLNLLLNGMQAMPEGGTTAGARAPGAPVCGG